MTLPAADGGEHEEEQEDQEGKQIKCWRRCLRKPVMTGKDAGFKVELDLNGRGSNAGFRSRWMLELGQE